MPTYEYRCNTCGYQFEAFQSITDEPIQKCPKCEGKVQRLIGGGNGFIFKGSGFYATDYRSKDYTKAKETETKSESKTESKTNLDKKIENKTKKPANETK